MKSLVKFLSMLIFMYFYSTHHFLTTGIVAETILTSLQISVERELYIIIYVWCQIYGPVISWFERCIDPLYMLYVAFRE